MALVKCPECGRENVSDTATSCPDCGYNIKAHYDKIKRDDEERIKAEEIRKQKEEKRKKDLAEKKRLEEVYKKEQEERERQEIEHKLEKQRNTKILYWCLGILVAVICVTMCIIGVQNENTEKALIELANNSFDADFESYKSALQGYGINIDATYEFGNMSYEEGVLSVDCNGVQREHNKKLNNGLPILHKVPPKRDYGRYFCIMAEKGGTSHGGLTEKLSLFFHAKKQEVNAYGR